MCTHSLVSSPTFLSFLQVKLREAAKMGSWLCLKNLHLVTAWLPVLEKEIKVVAADAHESFRLFLTTEEHPMFPTILLQQSLKVRSYSTHACCYR
jgi:hypothetical protein